MRWRTANNRSRRLMWKMFEGNYALFRGKTLAKQGHRVR
jgi:hypothetical protein